MAIKYDIVENIGILSTNAKGWTKELNLVSWNEREPKYDIRDWNEDHTRLSLIHISEPTRPCGTSRMPSSA